jgi:hypothetical protein
LRVVFTDGSYFERYEYDGSEWWEFKATPVKPGEYFKPDRLIGCYWPSLEDLHDPECAGHNWEADE